MILRDGYLVLSVSKSLLHKMLMEEYGEKLKAINTIASGKGYYLKPFHVVYKKSPRGELEYRYYGKYWYRVERRSGTRLLRYVGTLTGIEELDSFKLGLEGFSFIAFRFSETPVFVRKSTFDSFGWLLLKLHLLPRTP